MDEPARNELDAIGLTVVMASRFPLAAVIFVLTVCVFVGLSAFVSLRYVWPAAEASAEADSRIGASLADAVTNNAAVKAFGAEERERALLGGVVERWGRRRRARGF